MGSIARVNVFYTSIEEFFKNIQCTIKIYGTFLDGESVYSKKLDENAIIVIGNESKGISESLLPYISEKLLIPQINLKYVQQQFIKNINLLISHHFCHDYPKPVCFLCIKN